jgi:hypothetical protein
MAAIGISFSAGVAALTYSFTKTTTYEKLSPGDPP